MEETSRLFVGNIYADVQEGESRLQPMDAYPVVREYVFQRPRQ